MSSNKSSTGKNGLAEALSKMNPWARPAKALDYWVPYYQRVVLEQQARRRVEGPDRPKPAPQVREPPKRDMRMYVNGGVQEQYAPEVDRRRPERDMRMYVNGGVLEQYAPEVGKRHPNRDMTMEVNGKRMEQYSRGP